MFINASDGQVGFRFFVGSQLGFWFALWPGSWKKQGETRFHGGYLLELKERPQAYSVVARPMWNTSHVTQLGIREGPWLSRGILGVRDSQKERSDIFQYHDIVYGLYHPHLSALWLNSECTYSPVKWLGNRSGVDQFLSNIWAFKNILIQNLFVLYKTNKN